VTAFRDIPRAFFNGAIVPGARIAFTGTVYAAARVLADDDGEGFHLVPDVALPNPVVADAAGRWPMIYPDPQVNGYGATITAPDGTVLESFEWFTGSLSDEVAPRGDSGEPLPFCTLTFMESGTTVVLQQETADADGEFDPIDLSDEVVYRVILRDRHGRLIYDIDPYVVADNGGWGAPPGVADIVFQAAGFSEGFGYGDIPGLTGGTLISIDPEIEALGPHRVITSLGGGDLQIQFRNTEEPIPQNAWISCQIVEMDVTVFSADAEYSIDGDDYRWQYFTSPLPSNFVVGEVYTARLTFP
jgi:hypothetical protein